MKNLINLLALFIFSLLLFSCDADSNSNDALYENVSLTDDDEVEGPKGSGGVAATDDDEVEGPKGSGGVAATDDDEVEGPKGSGGSVD
ncbi:MULTISPECIES: hypothetical protein [unclassified Cellulophaga]|uniref:hypothetical protein n=1 Tax=unclassified Cellulophaga TaxID=2634405 RepID=UPI0026E16D35|nr:MULTISPECIES: hypothetical protein [unclassified Cellulophaga]MDO6491506.1 hypothetical protein [Cellulophaga sp. 2_MG-2023]MDO6493383.1 hypothetical protein [Cellulophaga sp. 3_MG-2023]